MKKRHMGSRETFRQWYRMPTAVCVLGILATVLLFWIYSIAEKQRQTFEHVDAIMDLQVKTATFHLWFEEAITEGREEDLATVFADFDEALSLSTALLSGGKSEHGTALAPLAEHSFLQSAENIHTLLISLKDIALKRAQDPKRGGLGSAIDERFDAVFLDFQRTARALEIDVEKDRMSDDADTKRLFIVIVLLWAVIVTGSVLGLYSRERGRKRAEQALNAAYEEMEERVQIRTAELANTNSQLREEVAVRQKAESSLRESENEFRRLSLQFHTLLDAIPDSITLLSSDMRILWANSGAVAAAKGADVGGQCCYSLWHGASAPCDDCAVLRSFQTGKAESSPVTRPDGRVWDRRALPMRGEDGRVENVIEIATDITEKITLQAETLRASHLASIGELAAGVAHEINNPINGIINYARILSNRSVKGGADNDVAERIGKEGRRIAGIVKSLLSFARDGKEEKKPVTLAGILRESLTLMESQMRREGIQVRIDIPPDLPEITANQQQIQQVFMNIINNAQYALSRKFPGEHEDKALDINCEEVATDDGPFVRIIFHDRGTGIAPDALDKIINPFFSTKPKGEGTGLGLSISHGIVADHGGRLDVKSVQGAYTKVQIDLPAGGRHG
jgi:C4-dicarboxylate-specific signal transduction histidine kinase